VDNSSPAVGDAFASHNGSPASRQGDRNLPARPAGSQPTGRPGSSLSLAVKNVGEKEKSITVPSTTNTSLPISIGPMMSRRGSRRKTGGAFAFHRGRPGWLKLRAPGTGRRSPGPAAGIPAGPGRDAAGRQEADTRGRVPEPEGCERVAYVRRRDATRAGKAIESSRGRADACKPDGRVPTPALRQLTASHPPPRHSSAHRPVSAAKRNSSSSKEARNAAVPAPRNTVMAMQCGLRRAQDQRNGMDLTGFLHGGTIIPLFYGE
jgi:hypothetical protein